MYLSNKQRVFVESYLECWNATEAARVAGYAKPNKQGPRLLVNIGISAEIKARLTEKTMSADEVLIRITEQAKADLGIFFKTVTHWTYHPLPTYDILETEEVPITDPAGNPTGEVKVRYLVRHVVIDVDKLTDPRYSHLLHKFNDSPKNGIGIELYNKQNALQILAKHYNLTGDRQEETVTASDGAFSLPADVLAPSFFNAYRDIRDHKHTEYLFYGGRGSTKSSFISLAIIYLLINNPTMHALGMRQVASTLRDSIYSQIEWAINELGVADKFRCTTSPMEMIYIPTGQKIYFRGADDPVKIKSIKPTFGAISLLWFEELPEFYGQEAIRNITQSAIRGTDVAFIFKSFNPPRTSGNWVNKYVLIPKETQYQHKSDYRDVPKEWLGQIFIDEAEYLNSVNRAAYEHEYLGAVNGLGDQVFENVEIRKITDEEIHGHIDEYGLRVGGFDNVLHGLDFGYFPHPAHYVKAHYDSTRHTLYIFGEVRKWKTSNRDLYDALIDYGLTDNDLLICDSAEPKSVADFRAYGATARGAEKGPESVAYSMKWLQSLRAIVIDNERAPYTAEEFIDYAYERTKDGELIESYPREKDDAIAAVRYSTNLIWKRRGQ